MVAKISVFDSYIVINSTYGLAIVAKKGSSGQPGNP